MDAKGEPGTRADAARSLQATSSFGSAGTRTRRIVDASPATLDVALKPGMSGIDDARFAHGVRFAERRT